MKDTKVSNKIKEIDYTKTSFSEIKNELVGYMKRHYPDSYRDFNRSSFGSLMLDLVSYVGDQLHYYSDHNANEAIPAFTKDPATLISHINSLGGDPLINPVAVGFVEVQVLRPAMSIGPRVDSKYEVELRAGSKYMSNGGTVYTQIRDITLSEANSTVMGYNTILDGRKIEFFILKAKVPVISGEERTYTVDVGSFQRFLKIDVPDDTLTEILKIEDSNGNEYYQVDHLTQDVIYKPIQDPIKRDSNISSILKPTPVPRRFVVEKSPSITTVVFGHGSEEDLSTASALDPSKVALQLSAKSYISSQKIDPNRLLTNNKLGVSPQNTTLTITYRSNTLLNTNAAVGTITQVLEPILFFKNEEDLNEEIVNFIRDNVQVFNEEPINGNISIPTTEELKRRYLGVYGAQNRAVTKQDYVSAVYSMPPIFGSVKRAAVIRDTNDLKRNINLYLISESAAGKLEAPSELLRENTKTWVDSIRMISDSVDIFSAKIINFSIEFNVNLKTNVNQQTTLTLIKNKIFEEMSTILPEIGEPFYISSVMNIIQNIPEVRSVPIRGGVKIKALSGVNHTDFRFDVKSNTSPDESFIYIPEDAIWEIKFIDDIKGTVSQ